MLRSVASRIGSRLLVFTFLAPGSGVAFAASTEPPITVELQLGARAGLDDAALGLVQQTAGGLLSATGINAFWRDCRVADSCKRSRYGVVVVQLLPVAKATDDEVCGETLRDARSGLPTVLVYVPRILALTHSVRVGARGRSNPALATLDAGHLIGLTIAHEVGHAFGLSHASSGVMKARLSIDDVVALRRGQLMLGPPQGALMRVAIATREERVIVKTHQSAAIH